MRTIVSICLFNRVCLFSSQERNQQESGWHSLTWKSSSLVAPSKWSDTENRVCSCRPALVTSTACEGTKKRRPRAHPNSFLTVSHSYTDTFYAHVGICIHRSGLDDLIRTIEIPPPNLRMQVLTSWPCMRLNYSVWCVCVNEYVNGLNSCKFATLLGEHRLWSNCDTVIGWRWQSCRAWSTSQPALLYQRCGLSCRARNEH